MCQSNIPIDPLSFKSSPRFHADHHLTATQVVLDLVPDYDVYQSVYGQMGASTYQPLELLFDHWDALLTENDSLSVFPDWTSGDLGMVVTRTFGPPGVPIKPKPEWFGVPLVTVTHCPMC